MKLKQIPGSWKFCIIVLVAYISLHFIKQDLFLTSTHIFLEILLKIIPIFVLIFLLMIITNYYITPEFVMKHLSEGGVKKWFYVIIGGMLSTGPIYMWYPLLADLRKKGLNYGLIACFLYNRAIKLPLIPVAIFYFGLSYIVILSIVMIIVSVVQGAMINLIMKVEK